MFDETRIALRSLWRGRRFSCAVLAILGLGVGSGATLFSLVDASVLRSLPFDDGDRIMAVLEHESSRRQAAASGITTAQTFLDWRRLQTSFEYLAAVADKPRITDWNTGETEVARVQDVTWEFFRLLRVTPLSGRVFTADDEVSSEYRAVVVSYDFWRNRLGAERTAVGTSLVLGGKPCAVVGIAPRGFSYPVGGEHVAEVFRVAVFAQSDRSRGGIRNYKFLVLGRLKESVSVSQASNNMRQLGSALNEQFPKWSPGMNPRVVPLRDHILGSVRSRMELLLAAVALVLLIACANVAHLMLARGADRRREFAMRAAFGASRSALVRIAMFEGALLGVCGAAAGTAVAFLGVRLVGSTLPPELPHLGSITVNLRVVVAATIASVVTGVLSAIPAALESSRVDVALLLREIGDTTTPGLRGRAVRSGLVICEVAVSVVLVVAAALVTSSFVRLLRVDLGFDYANILAFEVSADVSATPPQEWNRKGAAYLAELANAIRAIPGVDSVGVVSGGFPLTGMWARTSVEVPGRGFIPGEENSLDKRIVSPEYLRILRIRLVRGRHLAEADREGSTPVIVINESAARRYFPGEDALGKQIGFSGKLWTVVGVVADILHLGPEAPARQEGYVPLAQAGSLGGTLAIRTNVDPLTLTGRVRTAVWSINRAQRVFADVPTLEQYVARLQAPRRFTMVVFVVFGLLGLLITAGGIYGLMTHFVAERRRDIGLRAALGASPAQVVSMVFRRAMVLMLAGLVLGCLVAAAAMGAVRGLLFGVEPSDPISFLGASLVLLGAGIVPVVAAARRAAAIDPMVAIRQD